VTSSGARISLFFLRSVGVVGSSSIGGNKGVLFTLVLLFSSCMRSMSIIGTCACSLVFISIKEKKSSQNSFYLSVDAAEEMR